MKARPYSTTVYLIQPEATKIPLYVMMEMPAILYVLYEMNTAGQINASTKIFFCCKKFLCFPFLKFIISVCTELSAFQRTQQAQAFYRVLKRLIDQDPSCKDMCEIIYYKGSSFK